MTKSEAILDSRLAWAREVATAAGKITLEFFQSSDLKVDRKSDASPVTEADRAAELLIRARIESVFPHDGWVGEEFGIREGTSGYRWIIDPIDGTKSFVSGVPLYATLIGLEYEGDAVLGVIHLPALDEMVFARKGGGAWHARGSAPPERTRVSNIDRIEDGLLVTTQMDLFAQRDARSAFDSLADRAWVMRTWGDAYGYFLVATGRAAAMVDPIMNLWDAAAILPVIEEAGGKFTDWKGRATIHGGEGVASNGAIHDQTLAVLNSTESR